MTDIVRCRKCGMRRLSALNQCPQCGHPTWHWSVYVTLGVIVAYLVAIGYVVKGLLR